MTGLQVWGWRTAEVRGTHPEKFPQFTDLKWKP